MDVMNNAREAVEVSSEPIQTCVDNTIREWEGRLGNIDEFMTEHCEAMINYVKTR